MNDTRVSSNTKLDVAISFLIYILRHRFPFVSMYCLIFHCVSILPHFFLLP
ncbi:uncharacterized protein DS421_12g370540 [Arachis hypogaea]|nr:uncharacterized protein DS421_12g370540 [Arachis hypogaea]